jgi:hypothetical protein
MRPHRRATFLAAAFSVAALIAGCDSLPILPRIDLSGIFDGNHPAAQTASLDVIESNPDLTLRFHKLALKDSHVDAGSNEITLQFEGNADAALIADIQRSAPNWIAGTQINGDTATIVASKDVDFSTRPAADGFDLTLKQRAANAAPSAAPTEPVEEAPLRGDTNDAGLSGDIDGAQREDLNVAFGVDDKSASGAGL